MTEKTQWAWSENDYYAQGPFDTREEAIRDATNDADERVVSVGQVVWIRPEDHVWDDLDSLLEHMEEHAFDETALDIDGECYFEVDDLTAAQDDLTEVLKAWARRHLSCGYWMLQDSPERVTLVRDDDEKE